MMKMGFLTKEKGASGYTLFELVMTLFVISLLSAVVLPVVGNMISHLEARSFVLQLEADIAFAQKRAIATERPVRLNVNGFVRPNGNYLISETTGPRRATIKTVYFPKSVSITDTREFTFQPNYAFAGHSNGGTLLVNRDGQPFAAIIITPFTSRTRVEWQ